MKTLIKPYLLEIKGYSSAKDEFTGVADVFLDANENPFNNGYNRYPDSQQKELRKAISELKGIPFDQIFLSNGSDVIVDKLIRIFCRTGEDAILINSPTFPMYKVMAAVNNVGLIDIQKTYDYQLDMPKLITAIKTNNPKVVFICSPNNPVGNTLHRADIIEVLNTHKGVTIIDEAYIDFAEEDSFLEELRNYPNLAILQTFSKAWGLAGIRLGACYGPTILVDVLKRISTPYAVNGHVQKIALDYLLDSSIKDNQVTIILEEKKRIRAFFEKHPSVKNVLPSSTNFLVIEFDDGLAVYGYLLGKGIITRNLNNALPQHLRITVGTKEENDKLIDLLDHFSV